MHSNQIQVLRGQVLQHGKTLDRLPDSNTPISMTALGAGGAMLSASAARALVSLFRAEDDLVIVDRCWLRQQLINICVQPGQADLLLDNIALPVNSDTPELMFRTLRK